MCCVCDILCDVPRRLRLCFVFACLNEFNVFVRVVCDALRAVVYVFVLWGGGNVCWF